MIICDKYKWIHANLPKTGSMSMVKWLCDNYGGRWFGAHHAINREPWMDDYMTSTVVRDPVDRLLSFWRHTDANGQTGFEHFLNNAIHNAVHGVCIEPISRNYPWYQLNATDWCRKAKVDVVLRYEELPGCLGTLPFVDPENIPPFPHENRAHERLVDDMRPRCRDEINETEQALIWEHSGPDFGRFGYEWPWGER